MLDVVRFRFERRWKAYNTGEVVAYPPTVARALQEMGVGKIVADSSPTPTKKHATIPREMVTK